MLAVGSIPVDSANIEIVGWLNESINDSIGDDDTRLNENTDSLTEIDFDAIPIVYCEDETDSCENEEDNEECSDSDDYFDWSENGVSDSVRIQTISNEQERINNSNEERVFPCNYSLETAPRSTMDIRHIVKKSQHYPCHSKIDNLSIRKEGSTLKVNICKGTSPWKKNCQRTHRITLKRDKNHSDGERYRFSMEATVDQNGLMILSFMWDDSGEPIPVIDVEEVKEKTVDQSRANYCCIM